jgi:hypothetical protein
MNDARNPNGTFAVGNAGGPGRPRRAVEGEYLTVISDALPLDTWREIVEKAIADAKAGDAKAREWLTRHVIGDKPMSLFDLAAKEAGGNTVEREIERQAKSQAKTQATLDLLLGVS